MNLKVSYWMLLFAFVVGSMVSLLPILLLNASWESYSFIYAVTVLLLIPLPFVNRFSDKMDAEHEKLQRAANQAAADFLAEAIKKGGGGK